MGIRQTCRAAAACRLPVALAAVLIAATGCRYPRALRTYEYLTDYDRMVEAYEPLLSLVYVPQPTAFNRYRGIVIGPVTVGEQWVEGPSHAPHYATFFRIVLQKELNKLKRFEFVGLDAREAASGGSLEGLLLVEGKITRFDMGSGLMRYLSYFLWFLQSGATDLQIEGRISEADSGKLVMEFADRRRHLCNTPFGPSPRNFTKGFAMNVTATEMARCLAKFIDIAHEGVPAAVAEARSGTDHASDF